MNWTWLDDQLPEPAVSLALIDLCRPGQTVFDVGSHHGYLSVIASRLIGPKGLVCAFEASRQTATETRKVVQHYACPNIFIVHAAVCEQNGTTIPLYEEAHGGDSIVYERNGTITDMPTTLTLDKFCEDYQITPDIIKMDIEGAEKMALIGAQKTLSKYPHLILEMSSDDIKILDMLHDLGYRIIVDLNNYNLISCADDFPEPGMIRNILCLNHSIESLPYTLPREHENRTILKNNHCAPGRYVARLSTKQQSSTTIEFSIKSKDSIITKFTGPLDVITKHYRDLPFHIYEPMEISANLSISEEYNITIERIDGMEGKLKPMLL